MTLGLLLRHLAGLAENHRATNRVVVEEEFLGAVLSQVALPRDGAAGDLLSALDSELA